MARFAVVLCLLTLSTPLALTQGPSPTPSVAKDATAVAAITQLAVSTGWSSAKVPQDAIASGTLTIYAGSDSATFTVVYKIKGNSEFTTELTNAGGTTKTVSNGKAASVLLPDGSVDPLPSFYAYSMKQMVFPFMMYLNNAVSAPEVRMSDAGAGQIAGEVCQGVALARVLPAKDPTSPIEDLGSPMTIWISRTALPTAIDYILLARDNFRAVMHRLRTFSDYRPVGGLSVPFHHEEFVDGQLILKLDLDSVKFNSGLTDADFSVPVPQGGQ